MLGEDSAVLGKLIYALGIFVVCAGESIGTVNLSKMVRAFLDIAWTTRYHTQVYVRHSILVSVNSIIEVVPPHVLLSEDISNEMNELTNWLQGKPYPLSKILICNNFLSRCCSERPSVDSTNTSEEKLTQGQ